jgi:hypothetical protein
MWLLSRNDTKTTICELKYTSQKEAIFQNCSNSLKKESKYIMKWWYSSEQTWSFLETYTQQGLVNNAYVFPQKGDLDRFKYDTPNGYVCV